MIMTPEIDVGASFVIAVIVAAILYLGGPAPEVLKCPPRCGAQMQIVGDELGGFVIRMHVVPAIPRLQCPQCGYKADSAFLNRRL